MIKELEDKLEKISDLLNNVSHIMDTVEGEGNKVLHDYCLYKHDYSGKGKQHIYKVLKSKGLHPRELLDLVQGAYLEGDLKLTLDIDTEEGRELEKTLSSKEICSDDDYFCTIYQYEKRKIAITHTLEVNER